VRKLRVFIAETILWLGYKIAVWRLGKERVDEIMFETAVEMGRESWGYFDDEGRHHPPANAAERIEHLRKETPSC